MRVIFEERGLYPFVNASNLCKTLQTRLKPYLDAVNLQVSESGIALDFSAVEAAIQAKIDADPVVGMVANDVEWRMWA